MDAMSAKSFVDAIWDAEVIPQLVDYIRIPNKSPAFDADWQAHGYMDAAVEQFAGWARGKIAAIAGASVEVVRLEGRTPVIFVEIPGSSGSDDTVLLYGHLDKQPEMSGWAQGLGPWEPVLKDGRLYGRGGADDGYALFGALSAILALKAQGVAHTRCTILIEACEESGSYDLPAYVEHLAARIGTPSLVVCLDSGCGNYERIVADIRQQIEDAQRLAKERERKLAKERERIRQDNLLATTTRKILTTLERKLKPGEEGESEEFKRRVAHILPIEQASAGTGFGTNDKFRKTAEPARGFPYANKADDRVEAGKSIRGATLDNHYARWRKFANDWSDSSDGGTEVEQDMNPWQEHTGEWFDSPYPCKICGCPFWNAEGKFVCHC